MKSVRDLLEAKSIADSQLSNSNIDRDLEDVLKNICHIQINPNKFVDNAKMEEAVKEAQKSVPKEIIKKNQIIVKEGEPVTERQIEILKEYLPQQLSEEEIKEIVIDVADNLGASSMKDMGRVMAEVRPKIVGRADGRLVSSIVKNYLNNK